MRRSILTAVAVAAALAGTTEAAEPSWTLVKSDNLAVIGQQPTRTLRGIAASLEQFRLVLGGLINNAQRPLPLPTLVYVFGTHREFEPFLPLANGKPRSVAGYFRPDGDLNAIALQLETFDESSRVIFHEYTHLLLHNAARAIPLWLDEGLAEYYSTYALDGDGTRANLGRPIVWHVAALRQTYVPIATLIEVDHASPMYNETERQTIFYAEAWALTHYLMTALPDGGAAINRYATGIAKGGAPADVFRQAFGKTPAALDKDLRAYIHGFTFTSRIFTFRDRLQASAPDQGRTLPTPEASARLGDLQRRVGRTDQARARIDAALAAQPDSAVVQLAAGLLRLAEQRPEAAWAALDRAAALAPDDFTTQLTYGSSLLLWETDEERQSGNPRMERALVALTRATALDPNSSEAFAFRAYAEMRTPGKLTDAAASIRRAMQLAPGRLDYVLRYADIFMLAGSLADARTILTDVSRVTTDRVSADAAARRLAELNKHEASLRAQAAERAAAAQAAAVAAERRAREAATGETSPREATRPADSSDTVIVDLDEKPRETGQAGRPQLRAVQRGEERAYGDLVDLECSASQVRVHLRVGSRIIVATAKRMEDIALSTFVAPADFTVTCGKRAEPDAVYLTWRSAPHRTDGAATFVGTAVAIEFVPRGYTP